MALSKDKQIFVKFIINLSKGIDNCMYHDAVMRISKKTPVRFLNGPAKEELGNNKDELIKAIYKHAHKKIKKTKVNSIPFNLSLVAFVTAFETLMYDIFSYVVENNDSIKNKFFQTNEKIKAEYLDKYKKGTIQLSDIIIDTRRYNFQNLQSIHNAFMWATNKSLFNLLDFKSNKKNTIKIIEDLLKKRHKIIHEAYNDDKLNFDTICEMNSFLLHAGMIIHYQFIWNK